MANGIKIDREHLKPVPVGKSDWEGFCQTNYTVDKTLLIKELRDDDTGVALFTRPRRFGKSLLLSTLKALFQGRRELFKGLAIERPSLSSSSSLANPLRPRSTSWEKGALTYVINRTQHHNIRQCVKPFDAGRCLARVSPEARRGAGLERTGRRTLVQGRGHQPRPRRDRLDALRVRGQLRQLQKLIYNNF